SRRRRGKSERPLDTVAGNGLIDRRALIGRGLVLAGAMGAGAAGTGAASEPLAEGPWSLEPGDPITPYGLPSEFEEEVARTLSSPDNEPHSSIARTPHHLVNGSITPNGVHFVIVHSGIPAIDPDKHRLVIHGLVKRPLVFTLDALARYPMVSRMAFVECGGNSGPLVSPQPLQGTVEALHGLASWPDGTGAKS